MLSKKKLIRVLHLASFLGNIGDLINHAGAYRMFDQYIDYKFKIETMEIREFYWKKRAFDADFIDYAKLDKIIIGEKLENGEEDFYKIKFILKTGELLNENLPNGK